MNAAPAAPTAIDMLHRRDDDVVTRLRQSETFRDYQQAFQTATGLPLALRAQNAFFVDALASASWREFELGVSGTNLLALGYFDAQYLVAGAQHVLVAPPTMVLVTLEVHIDGRKSSDGYESGQ